MNIEEIRSKVRLNLSNRWYNMTARCYDVKHPRYKDYGGHGVYIDDEWRNKETFLADAILLPGYDETKLLSGLLHLDKDSRIAGNDVYSKHTCAFISIEENNTYKPNQMVAFIGTSPNSEEFEGLNQSEFARQHNLRQSTIADCLNGRVVKHCGWTFRYKE